jgi:hypothetical protein
MMCIEMYIIVGGGSLDVRDMFWGNQDVVRNESKFAARQGNCFHCGQSVVISMYMLYPLRVSKPQLLD